MQVEHGALAGEPYQLFHQPPKVAASVVRAKDVGQICARSAWSGWSGSRLAIGDGNKPRPIPNLHFLNNEAVARPWRAGLFPGRANKKAPTPPPCWVPRRGCGYTWPARKSCGPVAWFPHARCRAVADL
jgi:hypothetical protein